MKVDKSIKPPPFIDLNNPNRKKFEDSSGYFPSMEEALIYSEGAKKNPYHEAKVTSINHLMKQVKILSPSPRVLDFGIGDGNIFNKIDFKNPKIIGIDISDHMCQIAKKNLHHLDIKTYTGNADQLTYIKNETVNIGLVINTLGYLTKKEEVLFFNHMNRILKKDGNLIIITGNELFDLFALNSGTSEFFKRNFNQPEAHKLLKEGKASRFKNAPRKNPFNFKEELKSYGFKEIAQSFSNWHVEFPSTSNKKSRGNFLEARNISRNYDFDPMTLPPFDLWKAYFRCSVFGSLSQKIS